jgi:hypothetical protein
LSPASFLSVNAAPQAARRSTSIPAAANRRFFPFRLNRFAQSISHGAKRFSQNNIHAIGVINT